MVMTLSRDNDLTCICQSAITSLAHPMFADLSCVLEGTQCRWADLLQDFFTSMGICIITLLELHVHAPMVWRSRGLDYQIEVGLPLRKGLYLEIMASWLFHIGGAIVK
jgi:hypothetical protein